MVDSVLVLPSDVFQQQQQRAAGAAEPEPPSLLLRLRSTVPYPVSLSRLSLAYYGDMPLNGTALMCMECSIGCESLAWALLPARPELQGAAATLTLQLAPDRPLLLQGMQPQAQWAPQWQPEAGIGGGASLGGAPQPSLFPGFQGGEWEMQPASSRLSTPP